MNNSSIKLSEHFTLGEMCKTSVKYKNVPNEVQVENLKRLCSWLEMLRSEWNRRYGEGNDPIIINSGFRSEAVNNVIGGVATSNHLTGCAVDIRTNGMEQAIEYAAILINYAKESAQDYDELLIEKNRYGAVWVHFAVRPKDNRRKVAFIQA
ncbi:Peptidase M15 [Xylanibacter ruminicola]|uniref:Peptidase M15 n=1 Tax=Xylanibacter ruminicola TaxID=839 RepID=A0A1H4EF80_XYLRU|nr:D-Ala-D-Ala carboxypeptidase family metallohydrolase [Xylanibacter ruminicola]SEA83693.1 Peptidase M15 [Xylanibacter ruminicola]